jgi:nucleotide-binding universal stress UspA family protein
MFKRLLVPLDGSELAEVALPIASYLADAMDASVTLLHVIERGAPAEVHSERHLTNPEEADAYLKEVAQSKFPEIKHVETHVHTVEVKDVAQSIADHSEELGPDLIIMCTHGKGGPRDLLFGSIAQQVVSIGEVPVLLIPPKCCRSDFLCKIVLAPLDGQVEHEAGFPVAVEFVEATHAALYLLMVIPTLGSLGGEQAAVRQMLPGTMSALLDIQEQQGREYLKKLIKSAGKKEVDIRAEVVRGDPVPTIINATKRLAVDLIVLATHAKTGTDAFWSGSTAPKISSRSQIPMLLVQVRD